MRSEKTTVRVRKVGKVYRLFANPGDRVKQLLSFGLKQYHTDFEALEDISFDVLRGESLGIVGPNGAGKSTLLQLICGILKPTVGAIEVSGRVSALLELGSGFNPEFSGRENVYFQGAIMGFKQSEIDARFDSIAAFADIGPHLERPVQTYSSGMFVRLAFSVAIGFDPDVLILDEALAVGDARFQAKCFRRIQQMRDGGASIILVSHATEQVVRFCDRAILIDKGRLIADGGPKQVVHQHLSALVGTGGRNPVEFGPGGFDKTAFESRDGYNPHEYRFGNGGAAIIDYAFEGRPSSAKGLQFPANARITLTFKVHFHRPVARVTFAVAVTSLDGVTIFGANSRDVADDGVGGPFEEGEQVEARFDLSLHLAGGDFLMSLSVSEELGNSLEAMDRRYDSIAFSVVNPLNQRGIADFQPQFALKSLATRRDSLPA